MAARCLPLIHDLLRPLVALCPRKTSIRYQSHQTQLVEENRGNYSKLDPFAPANSNQEYLADLSVPLKRSFNLAAYVNRSRTLQELLKIGVSLYDIEHHDSQAAKNLILLDFERDCVPHIKFLVDNGLKSSALGRFISEFPNIFNEHLDDLQIRINYLESKGFTKSMIARALNNSHHIIAHRTKTLDFKLGELQIEFSLTAKVLREMVVKHPDIVAIPCTQYKLINFTLTEEFGFDTSEIHMILRAQPQIIDIVRPILIDRLDLIHNSIGLSHETIAKFPELITGPIMNIRHRAKYLRKLKRNQFNPNLPLYVPPPALCRGSDEEFCSKYCKTSLEDYKLFLRSC